MQHPPGSSRSIWLHACPSRRNGGLLMIDVCTTAREDNGDANDDEDGRCHVGSHLPELLVMRVVIGSSFH